MQNNGKYVLAIDQGTTSSRAILFDANYKICAVAQQEFTQHYPQPGWVEHDPEEIWQTTLQTCRQVMARVAAEAADIAAIGIANQRETTLVWDKKTARTIYPAIVWQDRRTTNKCRHLRESGYESLVTEKTGLLLDPYFSATKLAWILDEVPHARQAAENGELAFGTVDSYLLWRLSGGAVHATDATNASRTMLFDIHQQQWCPDLLQCFSIPAALLPEVKDCAAEFGVTDKSVFGGEIALRGIAGDQHAATIGQACFQPNMMKSTYGTGCFAILNTGDHCVQSSNRMLSTVAYRLAGHTTYALEGSIFIAGAAVQWLRDGIALIEHAAHSGELAAQSDHSQDVYLVPAFVGLGAPYWDAECRGAMFGLTRGTGREEIARATLEAVCYQTRDLLTAMHEDWADARETTLRVDGGMVASDWTMQRLSDLMSAEVDRPHILETTALGAAWLAGQQTGFYGDMHDFARHWQLETRFTPKMSETERERKYLGWKDAVRRTLSTPN
ncbi:MAG: glycerol kinase GlpK [Gammaproteobacteria bacterium]|nr:glycerol kinase GlpK [Gammaproteobacteria bacterium]